MMQVELYFNDVIDVASDPLSYAALWGCDPAYDKHPRLPGDGYMFYNFACHHDEPDFLRKFIPAIQRTMQAVEANPGDHDPNDLDELGKLLEYVQSTLHSLIWGE